MTPEAVETALLERFGLSPTNHQNKAFHALARLLCSQVPRPVLVLQGAAGTGKTTMMQALVNYLADEGIRSVLLAPTGRAAKVLARRTGRNASTIHKYIYSTQSGKDGSIRFKLDMNDDPAGTVYIVDEASMLGNEPGLESGGYQSRPLLEDLIQFAFSNAADKKLLFLGDPAQLPPVGSIKSPALSTAYLKEELSLTAGRTTLTEVKRQALESGVLSNATKLRQTLDGETPLAELTLQLAEDVQLLENAQQMIDTFCSLYEPDRPESCVVLCHSNGMATKINQAIREQLFYEPEFLVKGDNMLVVKNYYQHQMHELPFVANGDQGQVVAVDYKHKEEKFGQQWCRVTLSLADIDGVFHELEGTIPLGLLSSKSPALNRTETRQIWDERIAELRDNQLSTAKKDLRSDPYIQCLQLKFGYAITTHKSQGGQWDHVILAWEPWLFKEGQDKELLRWSYTGLTRAAKSLYLYSPPFKVAQ